MKIEIDIQDIENIFCDEGEEIYITAKDVQKRLVNVALEHFVDKMYDDYISDSVYYSIKDNIGDVVKTHQKEIVDKVIDRVSEEIIRKKAIKNELPKKYELENISKEWEEYFIGLIDKAIQKRFKG